MCSPSSLVKVCLETELGFNQLQGQLELLAAVLLAVPEGENVEKEEEDLYQTTLYPASYKLMQLEGGCSGASQLFGKGSQRVLCLCWYVLYTA